MLYSYFGRCLTLPMRDLSVAEQRYKTVLAVVADGRTVKEVAHPESRWRVLKPRSARPARIPSHHRRLTPTRLAPDPGMWPSQP
jgi:hypothetical protein